MIPGSRRHQGPLMPTKDPPSLRKKDEIILLYRKDAEESAFI